MAVAQVNGDITTPHSAFLDHILSYPFVVDSIDTVKANQLAQRSFKIGDTVYQTFAVPVLPLLKKPYGLVIPYVTPYAEKADALGDKTLDRVDERFPAIKKPTSELYNETREYAGIPYQKAIEGKDHVFEVYATELKKIEQDGLVAQGKAAVTTAFVVSNETLSWLSNFVSAKKTEATEITKEKVNQ
ncbi:hypothetical protein PT974_02515 [Cladobotryum mycophilum]|uniref:Uncharacterized protein n=1 Tax=Cladobotryum mycophilum TaxID=491253 RepID=A0ABR0SYG9_9HYPO